MNTIIETLNQWGGRLMQFGWPMLVQSSILIVLVLLLDWALSRRVRAVTRYALFLLLLVKLVLPPTLAFPTGVGYWIGSHQPSQTPRQVPASFNPANSPRADYRAHSITPPYSVTASIHSSGIVLLVWLGGVLALLSFLACRSRLVVRTVARSETASDFLQRLLDDCRLQSELRRKVRLRISAESAGPAVCGLWRPIVLVPRSFTDKLSTLQMRAVLLHELAHVKRADVWVNCAQTILQILYWWHPLLWLANARIRRAREQAVDEMVMVELRNDADAYPSTLLEVARLAFARPPLTLGLVGILESKTALKQRIRRLLQCPTPRNAQLNPANLTSCLLLGALLLPMARAQRVPPEIPVAKLTTRYSADANRLIVVSGWFIGVPHKRLPELLPAPGFFSVRPGVKAWTLDERTLRWLLFRMEGLGGLISGTDFALLGGKDTLATNGLSAVVPITTQMISQSPDGTRVGESRGVSLSFNGVTQPIGSRVDVIPTFGKGKINLNLRALGITLISTEAANRNTTRRIQTVQTNFVMAANVDKPESGGGVLLLNDLTNQIDGRDWLVLISADEIGVERVKGRKEIEVRGGGNYIFDDRSMKLDKLHSVLSGELQSYLDLSFAVLLSPQATPDDLQSLLNRLNWLGVKQADITILPKREAAPAVATQGSAQLSVVVDGSDPPPGAAYVGAPLEEQAPPFTRLKTRWFEIRTNKFIPNWARLTDVTVTTNWFTLFRTHLEKEGVRLDPPAALFVSDRLGRLMVRASAEDMEILQRLFPQEQPIDNILNFRRPGTVR